MNTIYSNNGLEMSDDGGGRLWITIRGKSGGCVGYREKPRQVTEPRTIAAMKAAKLDPSTRRMLGACAVPMAAVEAFEAWAASYATTDAAQDETYRNTLEDLRSKLAGLRDDAAAKSARLWEQGREEASIAAKYATEAEEATVRAEIAALKARMPEAAARYQAERAARTERWLSAD